MQAFLVALQGQVVIAAEACGVTEQEPQVSILRSSVGGAVRGNDGSLVIALGQGLLNRAGFAGSLNS